MIQVVEFPSMDCCFDRHRIVRRNCGSNDLTGTKGQFECPEVCALRRGTNGQKGAAIRCGAAYFLRSFWPTAEPVQPIFLVVSLFVHMSYPARATHVRVFERTRLDTRTKAFGLFTTEFAMETCSKSTKRKCRVQQRKRGSGNPLGDLRTVVACHTALADVAREVRELKVYAQGIPCHQKTGRLGPQQLLAIEAEWLRVLLKCLDLEIRVQSIS